MFVVVRIRKGAEIVKDWFGVRCAENLTLADLFEEFRSGSLDHKPPLELNKTTLSVSVGQKKTDLLTKLSPDVSLGEALPCLGNFIDFSIIETDNKEDDNSTDDDTKKDWFTMMMAAANKASHLPEKKTGINNQKTKLFNDIISWLQQQKVGFISTTGLLFKACWKIKNKK